MRDANALFWMHLSTLSTYSVYLHPLNGQLDEHCTLHSAQGMKMIRPRVVITRKSGLESSARTRRNLDNGDSVTFFSSFSTRHSFTLQR